MAAVCSCALLSAMIVATFITTSIFRKQPPTLHQLSVMHSILLMSGLTGASGKISVQVRAWRNYCIHAKLATQLIEIRRCVRLVALWLSIAGGQLRRYIVHCLLS